jgi:hypothetical protein
MASVPEIEASTTPAKVLRADLLRAALAYAEKGIPVFPCKGKKPLTRRGFKDASTLTQQITAWWNAHPDANIGIPTGKISGLLVLDVDGERGGFGGLEALEAERGEITRTRTHSTGSGGVHHLYKYPGEHFGNSSGTLPSGLDIRGEGGYIIAPPSATTHPYTVLDDAPLAASPEWLLEALRRTHSAAHGGAEGANSTKNGSMGANKHSRPSTQATGSPVSAAADGPIPDGQRNERLFRYGCALRAQGFDQEAILDELLGANERLCEPSLAAGEVEKIASSASRYEPGNASPGPDAETLEALDGIEAASLWGRSWKGSAWKTPRSVLVALIGAARKHGQKTKAGVRISIAVRPLALAAVVSQPTLVLALNKLEAENVIRRVKGSGTKSNAYVLITPSVARFKHSTTEEASPSSAKGLPHPLTAPRLRYSKPVYDSVGGVSYRVGTVLRLGKTAEHVLDILERRGGWITVADLGVELDIKHHRDLRRRTLPRLEAAGVVECSEDAVRLRPDWLNALNRKRKNDQELKDYERDRKKYAEESRIYALKVEARKLARVGAGLEEIAGELEIGMEDVYRLLEIARPVADFADGNIDELERVGEDFSGIEERPILTPIQNLDEARAQTPDSERLRPLYRLLNKRIRTHRGYGRLWQVFSGQIGVVLESDPDIVTYLREDEVPHLQEVA